MLMCVVCVWCAYVCGVCGVLMCVVCVCVVCLCVVCLCVVCLCVWCACVWCACVCGVLVCVVCLCVWCACVWCACVWCACVVCVCVVLGISPLLCHCRKFADIGLTAKRQYLNPHHHLALGWAHLVTVHAIAGPGSIQALKEVAPAGSGCVVVVEMSTKGTLAVGDYTNCW